MWGRGLLLKTILQTAITAGILNAICQSVTTPAGRSWNTIQFNFVIGSSFNLAGNGAVGTLFLLDQTYAGTPTNVSNVTPGFLASTSTFFRANGAGTAYTSPAATFDATFTLQGNLCGANCTAAAAAPELGTLLLLCTGFLALAGRRFTKRT